MVGRVIGRDPSNLQRYITLDVGREEGIARNMPVVTDRGLVGRISEVGDGWSRVLLIIDQSSLVNALTQSTRASGLIQGQADGSLIMRNVLQSDTVSVGDTVFTSGLGGNFPRQILIGQITEVERKDSDLYQIGHCPSRRWTLITWKLCWLSPTLRPIAGCCDQVDENR